MTDLADITDEWKQYFVSRWLAVRFFQFWTKKKKLKQMKTLILHLGCQALYVVAYHHRSDPDSTWQQPFTLSVCVCFSFSGGVASWAPGSLTGEAGRTVSLLPNPVSMSPVRADGRGRSPPSPGAKLQTELSRGKRTQMEHFHSGSSTYFSLLHRHLLL